MRRLLGTGFGALLLTGAFVAGVSSQDRTATEVLARLQPLLVGVQQSVPVSVTLVVPVGVSGTQTVTVPAVVDVNVQIRLDSTLTPTVLVAPSVPTVAVQALASDDWYEDNEGYRYRLSFEDEGEVEILEWTVYEDQAGDFTVAGEYRNTGDERSSKVDFVLRFYDEDEKIVDIESTWGPGIDPGETGRFEINPYVDMGTFATYAVEVDVKE